LTTSLLFLIIALLILIYYNTFANLIAAWNTNPDYSHGFLIPFIFLYMVWHAYEERTLSALQPSNWGLLPLLLGIAVQVVSVVGAEHFLQAISLLIVLWGLSLYLGGWHFAKCMSIPIGYLIFMIPLPAIIWNNFSFLLKLQASNIAAYLLNLTGMVPFMQDGNIFHLTCGTLEVVDACSGLRSLISMLAMGVLIAYFSIYARWKKLVLVVMAIPIAIAANIMRIIILVFLAERYGIKMADGFLHTFSGILVFCVGLTMLMGVHVLFSVKELTAKQNQSS